MNSGPNLELPLDALTMVRDVCQLAQSQAKLQGDSMTAKRYSQVEYFVERAYGRLKSLHLQEPELELQ